MAGNRIECVSSLSRYQKWVRSPLVFVLKALSQEVVLFLFFLDRLHESLKTNANRDWDYERHLLFGAQETIRRFHPRLSICIYHLPDDPKVIPGIIKDFGVGYRVKFGNGFNRVYGW